MWLRALGLGLLIGAACACPSKQTSGPTGGSAGSAVVVPVASGSGGASSCDGVRASVEAIYRDEAQRKEPKRVDDAVADNTAMVMTDCAKNPAKVAPCLAAAATVADIEKKCLAPLDPEGSEGEALGGHP